MIKSFHNLKVRLSKGHIILNVYTPNNSILKHEIKLIEMQGGSNTYITVAKDFNILSQYFIEQIGRKSVKTWKI